VISVENSEIIDKTKMFVKKELSLSEPGHDFWHAIRVLNLSRLIYEKENMGDFLVIALASLLHDIADFKFSGDDSLGPEKAGSFLMSIDVSEPVVSHVKNIIRNVSFHKGKTNFVSDEFFIVQDADRLDAIGAIGIARAFSYGGFKGSEMYNPDIKPRLNMKMDEYKGYKGTTINHFYEKLLLLKDMMNTNTGHEIAEARHRFMLGFLSEFFSEFEGLK